MPHQGHLQALLDPVCYPEHPRRVYARDTHASRLYFTPQHVYKIKKPVDFGFLDFTTLDRRRFFCEEEVRLNSRFAPGTYLGVVQIRYDGESYRVDGAQGEIVDYMVKMRRLPRAKMLDRKIRCGDRDLPQQIERLAPRLLELLAGSPPVLDMSGQQILDSIRFSCEENLSQLHPYVDSLLPRQAWNVLSEYTRRVLSSEGLEQRLLERVTQGYVREGHGDLHAEHICLTEPIVIYDCIEFNRRFRINDQLSELAFLLMDLDFRGRRELSRQLMDLCLDGLSGLDEPQLLDFYRVYRALVRGKVEAFSSIDRYASPQGQRRASMQARRYLALALGYLVPQYLAISCGLMGSGKSTLAAPLAALSSASLLRSDLVRKQIHGIDLHTPQHLPFASGLYDSAHTQVTYDALYGMAEAELRNDKAVVIDASFAQGEQRARFRRLAQQHHLPFLVFETECPEELLQRRLESRKERPQQLSDGRLELLEAQRRSFAAPKDDEITEKIDSSQDVDYNIQLILSRILSNHGWQP